MPNWCNNSIAFYQKDGEKTEAAPSYLLEAFYTDIQKYQNFTEPETGRISNWVGHYLRENRIDTDSMYTRGFFTNCELLDDHVRIDMETAWAPLPEVYEKMAEKYGLSYVYIAEECGSEVYVNTDTSGRFFSTRYVINCFDVSDLNLEPEIEAKFGKRLWEIGDETMYFDSFEEVLFEFEGFGFEVDDLEGLNRCLEGVGVEVEVYEYSYS